MPPDIVPVLDEILEIYPGRTFVLTVQVHQVEVVRIVNSLSQERIERAGGGGMWSP